jgi:cobalamin biosynthesis protein CbiG
VIVAGLGCRPAAEESALLRLIAEAGRGLPPFTHLAAPAFRRDAAALHRAAAALGLPLLFLPRQALEGVQPRCPTRSEAARAATGLASVAEACALAAAGDGARLLRPRLAGTGVTCAVAAGGAGADLAGGEGPGAGKSGAGEAGAGAPGAAGSGA